MYCKEKTIFMVIKKCATIGPSKQIKKGKHTQTKIKTMYLLKLQNKYKNLYQPGIN